MGCCAEAGARAGVGTRAVSPRADGLGLAAGRRLLLDPRRLPPGSADAPGQAPTGLSCGSESPRYPGRSCGAMRALLLDEGRWRIPSPSRCLP